MNAVHVTERNSSLISSPILCQRRIYSHFFVIYVVIMFSISETHCMKSRMAVVERLFEISHLNFSVTIAGFQFRSVFLYQFLFYFDDELSE